MSLQDDIERYADKYRTTSAGLTDAITAGLERDYVVIARSALPPVAPLKGHAPGWMRMPSGHVYPPGVTPAEMRKAAAEYLALAEHQETKQSALAERREVTARFLGFEGYECLHHDNPGRFATDEVIRLQDKVEGQS